MTLWLKQSTAVTVKMGPFVDSTDGVTAETGLTISQADIRLSKNGGDYAQTNNAAGATHDEIGLYGVPLNTTDTNTLGTLRVDIQESGALPVWQTFMVVPSNVWDSMFGADSLEVDAVAISGDSTAADNAESFFDGTGYAGTGNTIPTVTNVTTVNALAAAALDDMFSVDSGNTFAGAVAGSVVYEIGSEGGGSTPAQLWTYATRTLTQSAASVVSAVSGSTLTITRGDTFTATITGLGSIATRTRLYFTVKTDPASQADSAAIIQIEESDGLKYLNGAAASVAGQGSITVDDEDAGDITIVLAAAASDDLAIRSMTYDVQMVTATAVTTLTSATCTVAKDVTRAVA